MNWRIDFVVPLVVLLLSQYTIYIALDAQCVLCVFCYCFSFSFCFCFCCNNLYSEIEWTISRNVCGNQLLLLLYNSLTSTLPSYSHSHSRSFLLISNFLSYLCRQSCCCFVDKKQIAQKTLTCDSIIDWSARARKRERKREVKKKE